jgi:hypothetical protein
MKLYEVNAGGAMYWIAARDRAQALRLFYRDVDDGGLETEQFIIGELDEARARSLPFTDDDAVTCPLWEEFKHTKTPQVLGCSEWWP